MSIGYVNLLTKSDKNHNITVGVPYFFVVTFDISLPERV